MSNTNSKFIQVKSHNSGNLYLAKNSIVTEVIGVTKGTGNEDDLLLSVVDETMKQVFRGAGTKVIYDFLENNSHLKREEIAEKPKVFSTGLKKLLGSGAPVIENLIVKNLYRKLELKLEEKKGYGFSDYVKKLKEKCGCKRMRSCKVRSKASTQRRADRNER